MLVCRDWQDIDGSDERDTSSSFSGELDTFEEEVWDRHVGFCDIVCSAWRIVSLIADGLRSLLSGVRGLEDEKEPYDERFKQQGRPFCCHFSP